MSPAIQSQSYGCYFNNDRNLEQLWGWLTVTLKEELGAPDHVDTRRYYAIVMGARQESDDEITIKPTLKQEGRPVIAPLPQEVREKFKTLISDTTQPLIDTMEFLTQRTILVEPQATASTKCKVIFMTFCTDHDENFLRLIWGSTQVALQRMQSSMKGPCESFAQVMLTDEKPWFSSLAASCGPTHPIPLMGETIQRVFDSQMTHYDRGKGLSLYKEFILAVMHKTKTVLVSNLDDLTLIGTDETTHTDEEIVCFLEEKAQSYDANQSSSGCAIL